MDQPNIVFITTDTQGQGMLSCYVDRPGVNTPNLDRLAENAVLFENSFAACPLCTPARSAWYSGLHPNRNGAWCNNVSMRRHTPLLAEILSERGYQAKHLGKWHLDGGSYNGHGSADGGFDQDTWYDMTNYHQDTAEPGADYPNRFREWNLGIKDENYCVGHRVADRAIEIIKRQPTADKPLFLAVEFDEPHGPYICPPPFRGRNPYESLYRPPTLNANMAGKPEIQKKWAAYMRKNQRNPEDLPAYYSKYYDTNSYVDYEIGRVLDAALQYGGDNTMIIFTSDHGDHVGAFGLRAKGPTMYDHTTAVPLIIRAPGIAEDGRREKGMVSSVDIWATVLDMAGVEQDQGYVSPGNGYTCQSLMPVLRGETEQVRDHVIIEFNRFGVVHEEDEGLFPIRCIRTDDWKLAINLFDRDELYNLRDDPEEANNLIDGEACAGIRNELHDRILGWQKRTRDPFRGPRWLQRPWRTDAKHEFEGLFTTGWKDEWEAEIFN